MNGYDEANFTVQKPAKNFDEHLDVIEKKGAETHKSLINAADDIIDLMMGGGDKIGKGFKNIKQKPWA